MRRHMKVAPLFALPLLLALTAACGSDAPEPAETVGTSPAADAGSEGTIHPDAEEQPVIEPAPEGEAATAPATAAGGRAAPPSASLATSRPSSPPKASPTMAPAPRPAPSRSASTPTDPVVPAPSRSAGLRSEPAAAPAPRAIEVPAGTVLPVELTTAVGSDTSAVEDPVSARVVSDVVVRGETVVPAGSTLDGRVTYARESGKVKGVAGLTVRFSTIRIGGRSHDLSLDPVRREARATKGKDAQKIGIGAGAGAVVGGLLGGKKGAAIGAAAGGAGGAGVVLATKGEEVRLPVGTSLDLRLADPLVLTRR